MEREAVSLSADGRRVVLLDQSALPGRERWLEAGTLEELVDAIRTLKVRGAPTIGICAAFGMYVLARQIGERTRESAGFLRELERTGETLAGARPTAVNLAWAVERMLRRCAGMAGARPGEIIAALEGECRAIQREEIGRCGRIARLGLTLLRDGDGVLTHCNAGPLAASGLGTALGPILLGHRQGMRLRVFADETRPLLQGARLTAWELQRAGVDVTLICDSMAGAVMQKGWVQACLVGCDRVAANGDTAIKIGTASLAVLARHYGVPFYVLGPISTVDLSCPDGEHIPIEERPGEEVRSLGYREPMAPEGVKCYNPAFDVTPNGLITAIVTDRGICRPPYRESLAALFEKG